MYLLYSIMDMVDCGIELPLGVPETLINGLPD